MQRSTLNSAAIFQGFGPLRLSALLRSSQIGSGLAHRRETPRTAERRRDKMSLGKRAVT